MSSRIQTLGILGAGRVGKAVGALAARAGIDVAIAGSADAVDAVVAADAVVLAVPLGRYRSLPAERLAGCVVVDAMNYWWELDGARPDLDDPTTSTSETVAAFLPGARVVKAFNHLSGYALEELARRAGNPERIAVAIAGDDGAAVESVAGLVDALGFDPVVTGPLAEGMRFEPGTELFGADADAQEARAMVERFWTTQRGRVVARARAAR
ncbi:NADPH-dependent F420 reductase [Demequina litorisediminis]|uniref:NADP oxidoreductase n=1 Tax=Demequina litorisediminis TaxID=1849022 RepID=A0ABQ6IBH3_9MICO|nr:NADP oxidoreductase [Demequina litorisediminis]GMA34327.1 NADP oxidoreductase [Demequina litorisediminis]